MSNNPPETPPPSMLSASLWWMAVRPRTLTMAIIPVVVGTALARHDGAAVDVWVACVTLVGAILIQAGTNVFNDALDGERGNDGPARIGPPRVTGGGLASALQVRRFAWLLFALALVCGLYLVAVGGWPILVVGLASLVAGWAYSGGPKPLSHTAGGELFVVLFFGLAAVGGSYFLQAGDLTLAVFGIGLALGLPAAAVLLLNNLRDHENDRLAGRRTLVHLTGPARAYWIYAGLLLAPFPMLVAVLSPQSLGVIWLALPVCIWLVWRCSRLRPSPAMNTQLALTAGAQVLLGSLLSTVLLLETGWGF